MYCRKCGTLNDDNAFRCVQCGEIVAAAPPPAAPSPEDDAVLRAFVPVGRAGIAIAAGYAGLGVLLCFPASPIALALGIKAVRYLRANPEARGMGRAVFGVVMGALGTILGLIVLVTILIK